MPLGTSQPNSLRCLSHGENFCVILLMEEILHQLIGSFTVSIIYRGLYIPGGAGFLPSTVAHASA